MMKWEKAFNQKVMWIYGVPCAMSNITANIQSHENPLLREKQGPYPFSKTFTQFSWWQSTANVFVVFTRQNANTRFIPLKHSFPSFHSIIRPFWKDDTATQTPLNNENVLAGSTTSLAQPVSCQTVNTVLEWRGRVRMWRNLPPSSSLRF